MKDKAPEGLENELMKLRLRAEYGVKVHQVERIPNELEFDWLKYIEAFEKAAKDPKPIKVKQQLGNPKLAPAASLSDEALEGALEALTTLMESKGIEVGVIYEVPARELYRFITEELMEYEVDSFSYPGMKRHFIYEEFHPNDLEDLRKNALEFLRMVGEQDFKFLHFYLAGKIVVPGGRVEAGQYSTFLEKRINDKEFVLCNSQLSGLDIKEGRAKVDVVVDYRMGGQKVCRSTATISFVNHWGHWVIIEAKWPELIG